ncbi:DUF1707 SHOCT-like domain-containing protein [Nocardioides cheoyonin]|uniref:DUF1707 SHOCT-like domain-containing protein n=1 Tax=Nocardioides cheoyonin TaxID=3156615 RepID=UPI0032B4C3F4
MGELQHPDRNPELRIGDAERHQVAEILRQAAGEGRLDLDELDERLEAAYKAKTYADLVPLTLDLPGHAPAPAPTRAANLPAGAEGGTHLAILSGFERKGVWTVPGQMTVVCFMGGADLDLREATFSTPECTIVVNAIMGGADIKVAPDVHVIMEGIGIMGGYSGPSGGEEIRPDSPVLRIKGFALMGGVSVTRKPRRGPRRRELR